MDTQLIEILGRNRLVGELLIAEMEVAVPLRDRGIDLIAYIDLAASTPTFKAFPIQMKASSTRAFSLARKYQRISNLVITYVWGLQAPEHAVTYALTYGEALEVITRLRWTETSSWREGNYYTTSNPGKKVCDLLEPYRITSPADWRNKLLRLNNLDEMARPD